MSVFAGTSEYYHRYRPGIPAEVASCLADSVQERERLVDLGAGTGQVVIALQHSFKEIVAVELDPDMLAIAEQIDLPNVTFAGCRAEDYAPPMDWSPNLVTVCRAFHWMDQPALLRRIAGYLAPGGALAIFSDNSFWEAESEWQKIVRETVQSFLGSERRAGSGVYSHHDRPYPEILRESPLSQVEEVTIPVTRIWNIKSILGYLYSTSFAARHLFGERLNEFEDTLRERLGEHDVFTEENEFQIRFGRRP